MCDLLLCCFFRITSTALRSGWNSPVDTSQWVKRGGEALWHFYSVSFQHVSPSFPCSLVLRNVRSTLFWLTSSNTWPPTGHLRTLILRLQAHWLAEKKTPVPLKLNYSSSSCCLLCSDSNCVCSASSCSQWSGRSSPTSTTSPSSSPWWASPKFTRWNVYSL